MSLYITDEGGQYLLNCLFNGTTMPTSYTIELISAATAISESISAEEAEVNDSHYEVDPAIYGGARTIDASKCAVSLVNGIATAIWNQEDFVFTGPLPTGDYVVGYEVISTLDANKPVIFAEFFANPFKPQANGDTLSIVLKLALGNGTIL